MRIYPFGGGGGGGGAINYSVASIIAIVMFHLSREAKLICIPSTKRAISNDLRAGSLPVLPADVISRKVAACSSRSNPEVNNDPNAGQPEQLHSGVGADLAVYSSQNRKERGRSILILKDSESTAFEDLGSRR